eukprot:TRINITY_DN1583_c0_g4_i1.p1 TRINITY_DN1583_c0_g4~~TRINITY_DN1583_c0_g4_i1.p1  ORF type:complete len:452 (+),score=83.84 TRINITY_DN1583_c0_g4_i1:37-1356(+)
MYQLKGLLLISIATFAITLAQSRQIAIPLNTEVNCTSIGQSVAVAGDFSFIAAPGASSVYFWGGNNYVYPFRQIYHNTGLDNEDTCSTQRYGYAMDSSVSNGTYTLVVTTPGESIIVYEVENNTKLYEPVLTKKITSFEGKAVAISGDWIIYSSGNENSDFIFALHKVDGIWKDHGPIVYNGDEKIDFGYSLDISVIDDDDVYVVIGCPSATLDKKSQSLGRLYILHKQPGVGLFEVDYDSELNGNSFLLGYSVSISPTGSHVVASSPNVGEVMVLSKENNSSSWARKGGLIVNTNVSTFGISVSINEGQNLVIASILNKKQVRIHIYNFNETGDVWDSHFYIDTKESSTTLEEDYIKRKQVSTAIRDDGYVVVGVDFYSNDPKVHNQGAVYLFNALKKPSSHWIYVIYGAIGGIFLLLIGVFVYSRYQKTERAYTEVL